MSGEAVFPAQIQDVKAAIRWLRANAGRLRLDPDRIAAWGGSAGGHLVALLGASGASRPLDGPELGHPDVSSRVQAVVAWYPATDFLQMDGQLAASGCPLYEGKGHNAPTSPPSRLLGGGITQLPDRVRLANPIDYISPDDAPILIQHGTADCTVPYQQSEIYWRALVPVLGSPHARLTLIDGAKHGQADFSTPSNLDVVFGFLDTYLER